MGKKKEFTICSDCPCLNNDYEKGSECNLDCATDYVKLTHEWETISHNCNLHEIKTIDKGGDFQPERFHVERVPEGYDPSGYNFK